MKVNGKKESCWAMPPVKTQCLKGIIFSLCAYSSVPNGKLLSGPQSFKMEKGQSKKNKTDVGYLKRIKQKSNVLLCLQSSLSAGFAANINHSVLSKP